MNDRYRRLLETAIGAFAAALGFLVAGVLVLALFVGLAVMGAWIAERF